MANKYLEHNLYVPAATFTGSVTGSTLTASAVTGEIRLGSLLSGSGVPGWVYITAQLTGTPGADGTYTVGSLVAGSVTFTSTTVTSEGGSPLSTPAWGAVQEGDGTAKGAATSATVDIDLSGATADAGDTFSVMGAVLTCVASGATTNQFNAGSGATLVSNLVTAINRTTNTSTVAAQASGWATPKVQDAVFARIGSPTTTLQIMTRAGSAQYNSSTVAQSGMTGVTGPWTFSGGAGGAWGYVAGGTVAFWPSAVAVNTYGVLGTTVGPLAGVVSPGDKIFNRAGRTFVHHATGGPLTPRSFGSAKSNPVLFVVDDGTEWPADGSTPVFSWIGAHGTNSLGLQIDGTRYLQVLGTRYADDSFNLKFKSRATFTATYMVVAVGRGSSVRNFSIEVLDSLATGVYISEHYSDNGDQASRAVIGPCKLTCKKEHNRWLIFSSFPLQYALDVVDAVFDATGTASASTGALQFNTQVAGLSLRMIRPKFENFVVGSELFGGTQSVSYDNLMFEDPDFGNITNRGPYLPQLAYGTTGHPTRVCLTAVSRLGTRDFVFETPGGHAEWNALRSFPTCSALLDDGVTPYSVMVVPTTVANNIDLLGPFELPRLSFVNSLADGARTLTLRFVAEVALTPTKRSVSMLVTYLDVNGDVVTLDTFDFDAAAIGSSSATWTNESGGFVTFQNGGTVNHNKYELSVSTPSGKNMDSGCEVNVIIRVHERVSTLVKTYFFDPAITVA